MTNNNNYPKDWQNNPLVVAMLEMMSNDFDVNSLELDELAEEYVISVFRETNICRHKKKENQPNPDFENIRINGKGPFLMENKLIGEINNDIHDIVRSNESVSDKLKGYNIQMTPYNVHKEDIAKFTSEFETEIDALISKKTITIECKLKKYEITIKNNSSKGLKTYSGGIDNPEKNLINTLTDERCRKQIEISGFLSLIIDNKYIDKEELIETFYCTRGIINYHTGKPYSCFDYWFWKRYPELYAVFVFYPIDKEVIVIPSVFVFKEFNPVDLNWVTMFLKNKDFKVSIVSSNGVDLVELS